jgi:sugar phosphate isomerase/epimerase
MPHVGFCFDCGHEGCFTQGVQFMPLYGDRVLCTHVHDNNCEKDRDLHLLPFDGRMDLGRVARQIRESGYQGPLTLEIHATNSDKYNFMTLQAFLERAALSIKRLRSMVDFETP